MRISAFDTAREALAGALARRGAPEDGLALEQALKDMPQKSADLHQFCGRTYVNIDQLVQESFARVGLGHRPLPPVVELVRIGVAGPPGYFLLLESPEPIE